MLNNKSQKFIVSREDWSLHRKGFEDEQRHRKKIETAIKNNLSELITEESIIMSKGNEVIKIPIHSLQEYKIRYNYEKNNFVGKYGGETKQGDTIHINKHHKNNHYGKFASERAGDEYFETEVELYHIEKELFAQLQLPNLRHKQAEFINTNQIQFNEIRSTGLIGNIDKKRTMLAALKRNALQGNCSFPPLINADLKYRAWEEVEVRESRAVVIAMIDTSGSMGSWEKYVARSFFFWMTRFLRTKYEQVEIVFIAHHTEAKLVSEEEFFSRGESGGTICSSAYRKAWQLINDKYNPDLYNIYPFHFSDGDNLTSDNKRCLQLVKKLIKVANMFGYGEVNQYNRNSTLMTSYQHLNNKKFRHYILKNKHDVYYALRHFFKKEFN